MNPDSNEADLSFIGECFVPFKLCFEQENLNNWLNY